MDNDEDDKLEHAELEIARAEVAKVDFANLPQNQRRRAWLTIFNLRDTLGIPALSIQSLIEKDLVPA